MENLQGEMLVSTRRKSFSSLSSSSSSIPRIFSQRFRTTHELSLREDSLVCNIGPANVAIRGRERGRETMKNGYRYFLSIPTRWKDNDVFGHVNNVEYYSFVDTVITSFIAVL
jgi:hypothetical protein